MENEFHQIIKSDKMFTLNKRTDGNERFHLLPVANNDYIVGRFAIFNWNFTSGHQLFSQAVEKYIKLILSINNRSWPKGSKGHNHRLLLEENKDINLFYKIINNKAYMELIDELISEKFIGTRYGENYLSVKLPLLINTMDSLVYEILSSIKNYVIKITVHKDYKFIFLKDNLSFNERHLSEVKL